MERRIGNSSIVRVVGNLLSGTILPANKHKAEQLARRAVSFARCIAAEVERTDPEMTDADKASINAIMDRAISDRERVRRISSHWSRDGAERTPRELLLLHLGLLAGIANRLLDAADRQVH